ncbi:hypothetical protein GCM10009767_35740 [Kocuria aegyptia]|uniref:HTH cro/C1-type domain-containing protein n=1 Tax=Kocuria aegyptia TaxID=330943 RepID=A0ABP4XB43_9MICC
MHNGETKVFGMEQSSSELDPKAWAREVSARIGRNVREFRAERGLSAQKLSDATAALGFVIPRSTIANMEAGRKDAISVQEVSVLAEALRVPLSSLLYSPLHPGESVRPVPSEEVPSYAALNAVGWKDFPGPTEGPRIERALSAVRELEQNRTMWVNYQQLLELELHKLRMLEGGALNPTPSSSRRGLSTAAELEKTRRDVEFIRDQIALREQEDQRGVRRLQDLGIEPWPRERHYTGAAAHNDEGADDA